MADVKSIREAMLASLPKETSDFGATPDVKHLYVPPAHIKALRPECNLVIGTRGVGKSVWTAALGSVELRRVLGASVPELGNIDVRVGFAEAECIDNYPDAATFAQLLATGYTAYPIWQAVILRWLAPDDVPRERWSETVEWIKTEPENLARLVQRANQSFADKGRRGLIVFDALDRSSQDWQTMDTIVRDLLRTVLWLRSYPRLSAKVFLRTDQFARPVTDFPDASKLSASKVELIWTRHDLHGLLWQRLINAPAVCGEVLKEIYLDVVQSSPVETEEFRGQLAQVAKRETPEQRQLFSSLAGPWMGSDKRRGVPYLWSVGHLADGRGYTSPRSFLAAIREAAEDSLERYPDYPYALHHESIKRGIQKASKIRVDEMAEDYPWVRELMRPLAGLTVPCEYELIVQRWERDFPKGPSTVSSNSLPPQHAKRGWDGIREDLLQLGIFMIKQDRRIDMPDLYRVGFDLGRRGGVKRLSSA